jgi:hypothetical protein
MENQSKPLINPGSMLNTSEGLLSSAALTALVGLATEAEDYRVKIAGVIGIAVLGAAYVVARSVVKAAELKGKA